MPRSLMNCMRTRCSELNRLFVFFVSWRPRFDESPELVGFLPDLPDHGFVFDGALAEARELFPQRLDARKTRTLVDAFHGG